MRTFRAKQFVRMAAACALAMSGAAGVAQQITYYDFDTPQANPSQVSYSCTAASLAASGSSGPLFCFNYSAAPGYLSEQSPSFYYDFYPPSIDPNANTDGDSGGDHYATQMTYSTGGQDASMWFSVPQNVANGFTAWFAFKFTPNEESTTADGVAFVIQNAAGGLTDPATGCSGSGSGPSVLGGGGGCMGYSGIDNSVALEFDTYNNGSGWDPNNNHIALQDCGAGQANSASHYYPNSNGQTGSCSVNLTDPNNNPVSTLVVTPETSAAPPATATPVTLADGSVHQVVVDYTNGVLSVYLDPVFNPGTHTPVTGSVPVFSGTYNLATALNLIGGTSAYVGFTSATGSAFEQHELMAWTFTPHSTATQQQPISNPGTPTTFPYGTQDYTVTYPPSGPGTTGITMVVTANTISPALFTTLIAPTAFAGSQCQIYDDTGGNCVIYSVSCVVTGTTTPTQCPSTSDPSQLIAIASSYNNTIQPTSPGFLQGDPFYSAISSISAEGGIATVTCAGECSVTTGQTVTIVGAQPASFNGTVTVASADPTVPNEFTYTTNLTGNSTAGGYLTSNNVENIFTSYSPQNLDGTSSGHTHSFSDFVVTAMTTVGSQTQLTATTNSPMENQGDLLTATVTGLNGQVPVPGGTVTFMDGTTTLCNGPVSLTASTSTTATATCNYAFGTAGPQTVTATYSGDGYHLPGNPATLNLNVAPPYDTAIELTFGNTTFTYPGTTTESVCVSPATSAAATGTVGLYDGLTLLTTQKLGGNGCVKWVITPALAAGTHTMTASYSGDKNNPAGNSAPVILTVNPASVLMAPLCGPGSVPYGDNYQCAVGLAYTIGLVKGTMNYSLDGGTPVTVPVNLGVALFSINNPAVGTHHLVLSFPAQTNFAAAGPQTETFTVTVAPVTVTLTPSTRSTTSGKTVSFTATVTSSSAGPPRSTGSVSFYDGATLLTTLPVNGSGVASYATTTLSVGTHTIKATYSGGTNYGTGSGTTTVTISK